MSYFKLRRMSLLERRQALEFSAIILAYAASSAASWAFVRSHQDEPAAFLVAVIPAIFTAIFTAILALWAVRQLRALDEMLRRAILEATAFAVTAGASLTFAYGLLEFAGAPHLNWVFIWPLMGALGVLGFVSSMRKYQ